MKTKILFITLLLLIIGCSKQQPVNYEYKCKYYTLRLREVNASTNMIQNNLNQLSEEGWVLDETVLHRDNEEWQTIFQIFKRLKK